MPLNKSNGNMYGFVTHTWNPIGGECHHKCSYCYMLSGRFGSLKKYQGEPKLYNSELKPLGNDKVIFVGSATDMFGEWVSNEIIIEVLKHLHEPENYKSTYLFQTKNPQRFLDFVKYYPDNSIFCTTIETNREYGLSSAPSPVTRMLWMQELMDTCICENPSWKYMVTMEPIVDFDIQIMLTWCYQMHLNQFNIGADSKNHGLPEPEPEKIERFIQLLKDAEYPKDVHIKDNLKRIVNNREELK